MAIVSDKKDRDEAGDAQESGEPELEPRALDAEREAFEDQRALDEAAEEDAALKEAEAAADAPIILGTQRFVFAAYFAGAIGVGFMCTKAFTGLWRALAKYKPIVGEPKEELIYAISAAIGIAAGVYYWRRVSARQYAEEVAEELAKVTWPSKKEVQNSTTVVVATTIAATLFFAVLDYFWRYVTDKIYGI